MSKNQIVIEIDESALERVQNLLNSYQKSWHTYYNDVTEMANENGIEIVSIDDRVKFCKENNLDTANMHKVSVGKQKNHKGWKCCKFENVI